MFGERVQMLKRRRRWVHPHGSSKDQQGRKHKWMKGGNGLQARENFSDSPHSEPKGGRKEMNLSHGWVWVEEAHRPLLEM
jgi:hypothetical protein